jgi:hypothetical protein
VTNQLTTVAALPMTAGFGSSLPPEVGRAMTHEQIKGLLAGRCLSQLSMDHGALPAGYTICQQRQRTNLEAP